MTASPYEEKPNSGSEKSAKNGTSNISLKKSDEFVIGVFRNRKISICKSLIPLKLTLFLYYGAGSFTSSFLVVLYKQRGVSLSNLSTMTMVSPIIQFLGTAISGIASDKLGRAKPVFVVNLLIVMTAVICIIAMPKVSTNIVKAHTNMTCKDTGGVKALLPCEMTGETMEVESCLAHCSNEGCLHINDRCPDLDHDFNSTVSLRFNDTVIGRHEEGCLFNVESFAINGSSYSWCSKEGHEHCVVSCSLQAISDPPDDNVVLIGYAALFVVFLTTYSNCYRCLDITTMFLVREHGSSFGHERCFAMFGNVLMSPLAGLIADATTPVGGERNYQSPLYISLGINVLVLCILYKLQVRAKPPAENMWRKTLGFLTKPEALSFFFVIFVLGTLWNFTKFFLFWYLEGLKASSLLIGLVVSVSALYGIPFLLSSHWWVEKIGKIPILLLAFLGYAINTALYSMLENPWYSLLLESTGIISYYLMWVAAMEHAHDIAPEGLVSTIIALTGALHFSVGKLSSGLIAKFIMDGFGGKVAFRFSAVLSISVAFLYGCYLLIWNRCTNGKSKFDQKENKPDLKSIEVYTLKIKD